MTDSNFIDDCMNIYNKCSHVLFDDNIDRPPFWPVIVTALIIFLTVGEIGSQSCENGACNHYKNVEPSDESTTGDIDNLISRVKINHTVVGWRRALIIAMLLSLIVLVIFYPGLPDGFDFFLVATIIFLSVYFTTSWFQWHGWKARDFKIEEKLLHLRNNIKEKEIYYKTNNSNDYYGYSSVMNHIDSILSE